MSSIKNKQWLPEGWEFMEEEIQKNERQKELYKQQCEQSQRCHWQIGPFSFHFSIAAIASAENIRRQLREKGYGELSIGNIFCEALTYFKEHLEDNGHIDSTQAKINILQFFSEGNIREITIQKDPPKWPEIIWFLCEYCAQEHLEWACFTRKEKAAQLLAEIEKIRIDFPECQTNIPTLFETIPSITTLLNYISKEEGKDRRRKKGAPIKAQF